jgi:hypothetical protein
MDVGSKQFIACRASTQEHPCNGREGEVLSVISSAQSGAPIHGSGCSEEDAGGGSVILFRCTSCNRRYTLRT